MRHLGVSSALLAVLGAATAGAFVAVGCHASSSPRRDTGAASAAAGAGGGGGDGGAAGSGGGGAPSEPGFGGAVSPGEDAGVVDGAVNPCGTECGPEELCDVGHLGLDDDCDGQ